MRGAARQRGGSLRKTRPFGSGVLSPVGRVPSASLSALAPFELAYARAKRVQTLNRIELPLFKLLKARGRQSLRLAGERYDPLERLPRRERLAARPPDDGRSEPALKLDQ